MESTTQPTNIPADGASKASDFQPLTKNPQTVPAANIQQQGNLPTLTNQQEFLDSQRTTTISVPVNPADPVPPQAKSSATLYMVLAIAFILLAAALFRFINNMPDKEPAKKSVEKQPAKKATTTEAPVKTTKPKSGKKNKPRRR